MYLALFPAHRFFLNPIVMMEDDEFNIVSCITFHVPCRQCSKKSIPVDFFLFSLLNSQQDPNGFRRLQTEGIECFKFTAI